MLYQHPGHVARVPRLFFRLGLLGLALIAPLLPLARAELFVSSFTGNRVLRYNEGTGAFLSVFVTNGSGGLNAPHGLAFGPDGNLYVASANNDAVLRYHGTNGAFLSSFIPPGGGGLDYPVGLEFRPDGLLYVSSQLNNSVRRYDAITGAFVDVFVAPGSGGLNGPSGMTFGPDGHLYVVGRFGNHVLRFDGTNGSFLGAFVPAPGGGLNQPFGIKFGPDGHAYVASGNDNKVARFHGVTGAALGNFVLPGAGSLSLPIDLAFGPNGDLFVASFNNHKIARFSPATGAYLSDFVAAGSGGLVNPNFFAFRPSRTYMTTIPGIGPSGPIEQRHLGLTFTEGPAADANGNVFFSDTQAGRIYKSDTRGLLSTFLTNSRSCNGLMFDQAGRLIACQRDERRIIAIDVATTNIVPLASNWAGRAFIGPNDLVVDRQGGVYFSDPNFSGTQTGPTQSVYYVTAGGMVSQVISNLSRPNGVILSPDEATLYVALSGAARLMSYSLLAPGVLGPAATNALPVSGDGLTLDTHGNLYLCQPGQNSILVRSPNGTTLGSIPFPEAPANCTFGGKDGRTLFVAARTSVYVCAMEATGHRFAWNPGSFADFQRKFFGGTNAPNSGPDADPDGDGAVNELEYLARTHPLCPGDEWKVSVRRKGANVVLRFPQAAGRGYDVETTVALPGGWTSLVTPGNPPPVLSVDGVGEVTNGIGNGSMRVYRVRIFAP